MKNLRNVIKLVMFSFILTFFSTTTAHAVLDAAIISHTIPASVHPGDIFQVSVTVQNTSTEGENWVRPNFRLYSQTDPADIWGPILVPLLLTDDVLPGNYKTFTMLFTAPTSPGFYDCEWQVGQNVTPAPIPFGELLALTVEVTDTVPKRLDAVVVTHTIPSAMCAGESRPISITMRNTGSTTIWYFPDFRFIAQNNPQPDNQWGPSRINLGVADNIRPGATKTFTTDITAPVTPNTYNCNWQMKLNLDTGTPFFGEMLMTTVTVVGETGICDDGNECTGDGTCTGGACLGTTPVANGTFCDIDNDCTTHTCTDGVCGGTINEGSGCNDGNDCTTGDTCTATGVCDGTLLDCTGLDDICTTGICNPYSGPSCAPDSTRWNYSDCDDGLYCNGTDTCFGGTCGSTGDPCVPEACDEGNDICGTPTEDCSDGIDNDGDTFIDCEDTDCDAETCDDGIACTEDDVCSGGTCDGTPNDTLCDDGIDCTDDTCDAFNDCLNEDNCPAEEFCDIGDTDVCIPTTTTTSVPPTTTIPVPTYVVTITPDSETIASEDTVSFSAITTRNGVQVATTYLWEIQPGSTIGSDIDEDTGLYTAGNNDTTANVTDTIQVTDLTYDLTDTAQIVVLADTPPVCETIIEPATATVSSEGTITFTATTSGEDCLDPDYEWQIDSIIDSTITPDESTTALYQAGSNTTNSLQTDTITVVDVTNETTAEATVTVSYGTIARVFPRVLFSSRWLPLPRIMFIVGNNTEFNRTSQPSFSPGDNVTTIGKIAFGSFMTVLVLVSSQVDEELIDLTVTTTNREGNEVTVTKDDATSILLLPFILDEKEFNVR